MSVPGMNQRVLAALQGAIVGTTYGAHKIGSLGYEQDFDITPYAAAMESSEILDSWFASAELIKEKISPGLLFEIRHDQWQSRLIENQFGQSNFLTGFRAPLSGSIANPLANGSSALARCLIYGMACEHDYAIKAAYLDSGTDHSDDGRNCAVALAFAAQSSGVTEFVKMLIQMLERTPHLKALVSQIVGLVFADTPPAVVIQRIPGLAGAADEQGASISLAVIVHSVLAGQGKFESSLQHAVRSGGACDTNALIVAALTAKWAGTCPANYFDHLGTRYLPTPALQMLPPKNIQEFLEAYAWTKEDDQPQNTFEMPEALPTSVEDELPPSLPLPEPVVERGYHPLNSLPNLGNSMSHYVMDGCSMTLEYLDIPVVYSGSTKSHTLRFADAEDKIIVDPKVHGSKDWNISHKFSPFHLAPGQKVTLPLVLQPEGNPGDLPQLTAAGRTIPVAYLKPEQWYQCGILANHDGLGYEKAYRCEDVLNTTEVFATRGESGTRWQKREFGGMQFDPEPLFGGAPGVLYLWTQAEFILEGEYQVIASGSSGLVVKINRQPVVKFYQSNAAPIPRPEGQFLGKAQISGPVQILIKIVRGNEPLSPVTFYMIAPNGKLARPNRYHAMPS
jgi:hypothetical protein